MQWCGMLWGMSDPSFVSLEDVNQALYAVVWYDVGSSDKPCMSLQNVSQVSIYSSVVCCREF